MTWLRYRIQINGIRSGQPIYVDAVVSPRGEIQLFLASRSSRQPCSLYAGGLSIVRNTQKTYCKRSETVYYYGDMKYLIAILMPPLYLFHRKKWIGFLVSLCLYCVAWLMLVTIFFAVFSPIPWFLSAIIALWYLRIELMHEHAEIMATKLAEKMTQAQMPPSAIHIPPVSDAHATATDATIP
jgi:hypothetical protein